MATIGAWGNIISFTVSSEQVQTLDNVERQKAARYAQHDIVGLPPRYEFIGPGLGTFSAEICLPAPLGVIPRAVLDSLQAACDAGTAAVLVINGANVFRSGSQAVIDSIGEHWGLFTATGGLLLARGQITWHEVPAITTAPASATASTTVTKKNVKTVNR